MMRHPLSPPSIRCAHCQNSPLIPVRVGAILTGKDRAWPIWACLRCAPSVRRLLHGS